MVGQLFDFSNVLIEPVFVFLVCTTSSPARVTLDFREMLLEVVSTSCMLEFLVDALKDENFFVVVFVGPETLIFFTHSLCWSPCFGTTFDIDMC